jgi:hypothetical protein
MTVAATERQREYISALLRDRVVDSETIVKIGDPATLTKETASKVIELLIVRPRRASIERPTQVGAYKKDGTFYQVRKSQTSGRLYAKVFDPVPLEFVYDADAINQISDADRMSLEEAMRFGVQYGICVHCGASLTDPESIARGIGPVCAKRF